MEPKGKKRPPDDRTAEPTKSIWVKVKGGAGPVKIKMFGLCDGFDLLQRVKETVKPRLDGVPVDSLTLYQSEEDHRNCKKALNPMKSVPDQGQDSTGEPLPFFIDYDTPTAGGGAGAVASSSAVQVTAEDFFDDLRCCKRPADVPVDRIGMVKVQESVAACMKKIEVEVDNATTSAGCRVPPLMLSRCMRGGKTTLLCALFDKLQQDGYAPIFVSFNGDTNVRKLKREEALDTMRRAISLAMLKAPPADTQKAEQVLCGPGIIETHLKGTKKVVLLVDELNVLLRPGTGEDYEDVGRFLRQTFLDPVDRYLVFSTHLPITVGIDALLGTGTGSSRDALVAQLPFSLELKALRNMDDTCRALTACEIAYYGGIPSLIYTIKKDTGSFSMHSRFHNLTPMPGPSDNLTRAFLSEFFSGVAKAGHTELRCFDSLTSCPAKHEVRWVPAYAGMMCRHVGLKEVGDIIDKLKVYAEAVDSGKDWELIVHIALSLRCMEAKLTGKAHAFLGLPRGAQPKQVFFDTIPAEHDTPEKALAWWRSLPIEEHPYLAVLSPAAARFTTFDKMVVYRLGPQVSHIVRGFQTKGTDYPKSNAPAGMQGVLMQGHAPKATKGPNDLERWTYVSAGDIQAFLGATLKDMYPVNWSSPS